MKKLILIALFIFCCFGVIFAQKENRNSSVILQSVAPIYPKLASQLGLEENINCNVKINGEGKINSVSFDRGAKVFHIVIEDALKQFEFEKPAEKERVVEIKFIFTLLPSESNSYISSIYRKGNVIEIFAKRIKIIDSTDT